MLGLSPPLPILLLLCVGGLSALLELYSMMTLATEFSTAVAIIIKQNHYTPEL
jgi:hypothetical protein